MNQVTKLKREMLPAVNYADLLFFAARCAIIFITQVIKLSITH